MGKRMNLTDFTGGIAGDCAHLQSGFIHLSNLCDFFEISGSHLPLDEPCRLYSLARCRTDGRTVSEAAINQDMLGRAKPLLGPLDQTKGPSGADFTKRNDNRA
jgi:hypothetical protein